MRGSTAWFVLFVLFVLVGIGACAGTAQWDPLAREPVPVEAPAVGDPNDPNTYYRAGLRLLASQPLRAADAFAHASRLDPGWGAPMYAQRIALLMSHMPIFDRYMKGERRVVSSPGVVRLDSLYLRALTLSPFLPRAEDVTAIRELIVYRLMIQLRAQYGAAGVVESDVRYELDGYLERADPATRAWLAHSNGRYEEAIDLYDRALRRSRSRSTGMRADLARVLFLAGRNEEARDVMLKSVAELRERDDEDLVRIYESKALYEHSLGLIQEAIGDTAEARVSYARALEEDLSFHPAHLRLADLALADGDVAAAVAGIELAAEIRPDDPVVQLARGRILARAGDLDLAQSVLRRTIDIEPLFARPYLALADVLRESGQTDQALRQYRDYIERAPRMDEGVREARAQIRELEASTGR